MEALAEERPVEMGMSRCFGFCDSGYDLTRAARAYAAGVTVEDVVRPPDWKGAVLNSGSMAVYAALVSLQAV